MSKSGKRSTRISGTTPVALTASSSGGGKPSGNHPPLLQYVPYTCSHLALYTIFTHHFLIHFLTMGSIHTLSIPCQSSYSRFFLPYSPPSPSDEVVTISVKDCGAGLSPEDLGRLFQEGVQINPNKLQVHPCLSILFYLT